MTALRWHWTGRGREEAAPRGSNRRWMVVKQLDGTWQAFVQINHGRHYGDIEIRVLAEGVTKAAAKAACE